MSKELAFRPKRKNSNKTGLCELKGVLDLGAALQAKVAFDAGLEQFRVLEINFGQIDQFDLPFFQLLFSFKKTAAQQGKQVVWKGDLPGEVLLLFTNAGIDSHQVLFSA